MFSGIVKMDVFRNTEVEPDHDSSAIRLKTPQTTTEVSYRTAHSSFEY